MKIQANVDDYERALKNNKIIDIMEKYVILVGWKPLERERIKLNKDETCITSRLAGCKGIIRDMHCECKGGFFKSIGICSVVRAELWVSLKINPMPMI